MWLSDVEFVTDYRTSKAYTFNSIENLTEDKHNIIKTLDFIFLVQIGQTLSEATYLSDHPDAFHNRTQILRKAKVVHKIIGNESEANLQELDSRPTFQS